MDEEPNFPPQQDFSLIEDSIVDNEDYHNEEVIETNHDFSADDALIDDEVGQEHYDPVIAAMKQEEEDYVEDRNSLDPQEDDTENQISPQEDPLLLEDIIESIQEETIHPVQEEEIIQEEEESVMVERTIEVIDVDLDGDGTIDETIVVQTTSTTPSDIAETKRQKSLEMIQFELRTLKDKGQTSSYEKKLIEARALHPDRNDFTAMLAEHYYEH
jgi:hypothetical protein